MKLLLTLSFCFLFAFTNAQEVNVDLPTPVTDIFWEKFGVREDVGYLLMYRFINPSPNYILNHIVMLDSSGNPTAAATSTEEESTHAQIIGLSNGDFILSSRQLVSFTESTPWIVQRFDDSFEEIWNYSYMFEGESLLTRHAIEDESGNIYLLAREGEYKTVVLKLNPDGTIIWSQGMGQSVTGNSSGTPLLMKKMSNGNICAVGTGGGGENTSLDFAISVFTPDGEVVFSKAFGEDSDASETVVGVVELENGDLMLIGYGPDSGEGGKGLLARVSSEGELIWMKKYTGNITSFRSGRMLSDNRIEIFSNPFGSHVKLIVDENGDVESSTLYTDGKPPHIITKDNGDAALYLRNQTAMNQLTVLSPDLEFEFCFTGESNDVSVSDYEFVEYDLGNAPLEYTVEFSHENPLPQTDIFLAADACTYTSIQESQKEVELKLIPNPASDHVQIQFNGVQPSPNKIEIFNSLGTLMLSQEYVNGSEVDLSAFKNGLHIILIHTADGLSISKKLLIAH